MLFFLSTRVERYDSNGGRIFLLRDGCTSDIPNSETDLILKFKESDMVHKKFSEMVHGVDLIQIERTGRSKYVSLFNLVVDWRKKRLLYVSFCKIEFFSVRMECMKMKNLPYSSIFSEYDLQSQVDFVFDDIDPFSF